jgi:hypothetical protein
MMELTGGKRALWRPRKGAGGEAAHRDGEDKGGDAQDGDGAGTKLDRKVEASRRCHDAEDNSHRAYRQIGQRIDGGEHATAMIGRRRGIDHLDGTEEQKAVSGPGGRHRQQKDWKVVECYREGKQTHARGGGERAQDHRHRRPERPRHDTDHTRHDREQRQDGAVDEGVRRRHEIVGDLATQRQHQYAMGVGRRHRDGREQ